MSEARLLIRWSSNHTKPHKRLRGYRSCGLQSPHSRKNFPKNFRGHFRGGGFTLIECLLAGIVMAGFGAVLTLSIGQGVSTIARAEDDRLAAQWLDEVLTRIDIVGPSELSYAGPVSGVLDERFSWEASIEQEALSDLYTVGVTISWSTPRGSRTVKAHTLLMDPPGWRAAGIRWGDLE